MTIRLPKKVNKSTVVPLKVVLLFASIQMGMLCTYAQDGLLKSISDPIERAREAVAQNSGRLNTQSSSSADSSPATMAASASEDQVEVTPLSSEDVTSTGEETISLNVDDQEIRVILRNIAELFELNIVIPEDLEGRTSLNLRDVTWQQVFNIVLEEKGYSWSEDNGIIRIRQGTQDGAMSDTRVRVLPSGLLKVEFRSTPVNTIISVVAQTLDLNVVVPPDEALQSDLDLRLSEVSWEQVFTVSLAQFGYGYINSDGIVLVRSLEQINGVPDVSRVFQVKYSEAESIAKLLTEQSGVNRVVTDSRSNVVIVTGNPSRFAEIKALIETLDRPTPQVMIESRFVEISNQDVTQVGMDWQSLFSDDGYAIKGSYESETKRTRNKENVSDDTNKNNFTSKSERIGGTTQNSSLIDSAINQVRSLLDSTATNRTDTAIFSAPAFSLVLRALKKLDDSKIVSNPTVLALNGQEAEIKIIDHYYVQKPGTVSENGLVVAGEVERLDPLPGIELKVTPTISGGDFISLKVVPQVNDIVTYQDFDTGRVPVVRQRTTLTHVMVKDRETLAIGGLIDEKTFTTSSKIPLLGSIPGLGRLFRYDKNSVNSTNQIIFITASILNPNEINYVDVVGIDRLNKLGLTDRDVMGANYPMSSEEKALNEAIMNYRRQNEKQEEENNLTMQLEAYRMLEEERALKALKQLEKTSDLSFNSENGDESASSNEAQQRKGKRGVMPAF
jgi:type IV pilus assembly protein PilQ